MCISDVFWMPNSEACLCVVTDVFVNVYDLSIDNISPSFSLRLPGATRITAATLCWDATTVAIMVMGEDGRLFLKRIGEGEEKEDGPMEMDMAVQVPKDMAGETSPDRVLSLAFVMSDRLRSGFVVSGSGSRRLITSNYIALATSCQRLTLLILAAGGDVRGHALSFSLKSQVSQSKAAAMQYVIRHCPSRMEE